VLPPPEHLSGTRFQTIRWLLNELCERDGFDLAVLIGPEGLPLAHSDTGGDPEQLAAVTDLFRRAAEQLQDHLAWPELDEVRIVTRGNMNLIGQVFTLDGEPLILALILSKRVPYREATSETIHFIRLAWQSHSRTSTAQEEQP